MVKQRHENSLFKGPGTELASFSLLVQCKSIPARSLRVDNPRLTFRELSMPIYEFQCKACGHRFERLQKMADPDPAVCPNCGEPQVGRMLSAPQFRLAGGGWYETDFKKEGDKKKNLVEGSSGAPAPAPAATPAAAAAPAPAPAPADKPKPSGA
jgi:putative FmdB family regulatory protein